ncbi:MAG: DNA cytosine methyltransferase [Pseudomonadota bacterium]|nr:DNA cytosine methyltransferase [Pseudomonadota bacterium]
MTAYYNEHDPYAAQWLRNLIKAGHIAPGDVDERSIEDVTPADLAGYTQCHFFAGIGVWSLALRRAGWPDDIPVWTGSCPCQPFSSAGAGAGFDDPRHLWPSFAWLIQECRPAVIFGEQVASKAVEPWIDLVQTDVEAMGYAFGCVPFPSAGVGAPHIRDRAYWVADSVDVGRIEAGECQPKAGSDGATGNGAIGGLADSESSRRREERQDCRGVSVGDCAQGVAAGLESSGSDMRPGPTNGLWRAADWLFCRDGKWRPVEPGTFPLADGSSSRVGRGSADWHAPAGQEGQGHRAGRLKCYGNAINAEAATAFIESFLEAIP